MNLKFSNLAHSKELALDMLRIYLGLALIGKGYYFIRNLTELFDLTSSAVSYGDFILAHYILLAHLVGGLCIVAGVFTRLAIFMNIPILFGAVTMIHLPEGLFQANQGLELSVLVLFLLCLSFYHGSGKFSVDGYFDHLDEEAKKRDLRNIINLGEEREKRKVKDSVNEEKKSA